MPPHFGAVAQLGERCVRNAEVEGSTPFRSTLRDKKPFGEHVEGLSYLRDESCVVELAVQKHDFEDSTFRGVVRSKPLLFQSLREFKNLGRQFGIFIVRPIKRIELQLH